MTATIPEPTGTSPGRTEPTPEQRAAATAVLQMIWGTHIARAVHAAAALGIPDHLAGAPRSCADLAQATGTDEDSLYRVLRLLAALGVLTQTGRDTFALTILGERLRSDAPASMRRWALLFGTPSVFRPFEHFMSSVRTGQPGFDTAHGLPVFDYLSGHPEDAAVFDAAMLERTTAFAPSVASGYDFSDIRTVVDVGGGRGILLAAILQAHPHLQGTLFELPAVASGAEEVLTAAGVAGRCEVVTGDFFTGVPRGADCYVLANVLHDWDDTRSADILAGCRRVMTRHGRILVVERLIPDTPADAVPALLSDINMLVLTGGRERTNAEYASLLRAAGLRPGPVRPVAFPYGIIEARRPDAR